MRQELWAARGLTGEVGGWVPGSTPPPPPLTHAVPFPLSLEQLALTITNSEQLALTITNSCYLTLCWCCRRETGVDGGALGER